MICRRECHVSGWLALLQAYAVAQHRFPGIRLGTTLQTKQAQVMPDVAIHACLYTSTRRLRPDWVFFTGISLLVTHYCVSSFLLPPILENMVQTNLHVSRQRQGKDHNGVREPARQATRRVVS